MILFCVNLLPLFVLTNKFTYEQQIAHLSLFYETPYHVQRTADIKYPCNKTRLAPIFTGMTLHMVILMEIKSLKVAMENMKGKIIEEPRSEVDRRRIGTSSFFTAVSVE